MSTLTRFALLAIGAVTLPALAAVSGIRTMKAREHPQVPARLDAATVAAVPRPAIDRSKPTAVVLFGADLTEITDALGPYEMFARTGKYNVVSAAPERQPTLLTGGLRMLPHYGLAELDSILGGHADVVIVPNLPNPRAAVNRPAIDWIRRQYESGALIHSWCKGAMALAESGILDGKEATAHWGDIDGLEQLYPRVRWVRGVRWVEHGAFVMSAGITSGIDASLRAIIRLAGDSVAQRVAREMRYPNYHYAVDPRVEQYHLQVGDLVLPVNAAFRIARPVLGVALYDGVGEMDLSTVYDAHIHTMAAGVETIGLSPQHVVTAHGLTLYPSLSVAGQARTLSRVDRLIVPGAEGRDRGGVLVGAVTASAPALRAEYMHADQGARFGLEPVIEDLARTADVATARFAQRRMEYRSATVRLAGSAMPLQPLGVAGLLTLLGFAIVRFKLNAR